MQICLICCVFFRLVKCSHFGQGDELYMMSQEESSRSLNQWVVMKKKVVKKWSKASIKTHILRDKNLVYPEKTFEIWRNSWQTPLNIPKSQLNSFENSLTTISSWNVIIFIFFYSYSNDSRVFFRVIDFSCDCMFFYYCFKKEWNLGYKLQSW